MDWHSGLQELILDYFSDLYSPSNIHSESILDDFPVLLGADSNETLLAPITLDEVKRAVFSMHLDKSPGPDGFNPCFFQKNWEIVSRDVHQLVVSSFQQCSFPRILNSTILVLIPKKSKHKRMQDLRPIALCNVLYKIISKVIANQLKTVLQFIISENQCVFLSGRYITDNILISFVILH